MTSQTSAKDVSHSNTSVPVPPQSEMKVDRVLKLCAHAKEIGGSHLFVQQIVFNNSWGIEQIQVDVASGLKYRFLNVAVRIFGPSVFYHIAKFILFKQHHDSDWKFVLPPRKVYDVVRDEMNKFLDNFNVAPSLKLPLVCFFYKNIYCISHTGDHECKDIQK